MRLLTAGQVTDLKLKELQLGGLCDSLLSTEAIASALRRSASFLCPCAPQTLLRSVTGPLEAITTNVDELDDQAQQVLEALVAVGDLIESQERTDGEGSVRRRVIYAAQPAFVPRSSGGAILLGVAPDGASLLTSDLEARVETVQHVRRLASGVDNLHSQLRQLGFIELGEVAWLKAPSPEAAKSWVMRLDVELNKAPASGALPQLEVLDPTTSVSYYRGRWTAPHNRDGRFVARRKQAYGAALWCYVELKNGEPERFVDLPLANSRWRGCDDAWRLQMALDATRGTPQKMRVRRIRDATFLEFFSPIPMWAQRRLDAVGVPVEKSGCLFAYSVPLEDVDDEVGFIEQMLWMSRVA